MKKCGAKEITKETAALVINENGEIIIMEDNYHHEFFSKILSENINITVKEDKLDTLLNIIVNQLNYISYMGCTSGDRKYDGGIFYIKEIESLTEKQMKILIELYSNLSLYYDVQIIKINNTNKFLSIGEIYEENLKRENNKTF